MKNLKKRIEKTRHELYVILLIIFLLSFGGCGQVFPLRERQTPTTIADLAYDITRDADLRIFLEENGAFVPYIVLTADYGGNVLVLREYLLDEQRPFNPSPRGDGLWSWMDFGSYYPNSQIDDFLNTEFMNTLGESVIDAMVSSDIIVTDKSSIGVTGRTSTKITRYIFLLSLRELGVPDPSTSVPEGNVLRFFRGYHAGRVAGLSNGTAIPYWTRTPQTWETCFVFTIGVNAVGSGTADNYSGVRPAFALDRSTAITTCSNTIYGEIVFVLCINDKNI